MATTAAPPVDGSAPALATERRGFSGAASAARPAAVDGEAEFWRQLVQRRLVRQPLLQLPGDVPAVRARSVEPGERRHHDVAHGLGLGAAIEQAKFG